jgi:hypothetical protein
VKLKSSIKDNIEKSIDSLMNLREESKSYRVRKPVTVTGVRGKNPKKQSHK